MSIFWPAVKKQCKWYVLFHFLHRQVEGISPNTLIKWTVHFLCFTSSLIKRVVPHWMVFYKFFFCIGFSLGSARLPMPCLAAPCLLALKINRIDFQDFLPIDFNGTCIKDCILWIFGHLPKTLSQIKPKKICKSLFITKEQGWKICMQ